MKLPLKATICIICRSLIPNAEDCRAGAEHTDNEGNRILLRAPMCPACQNEMDEGKLQLEFGWVDGRIKLFLKNGSTKEEAK